MAARLEWKGCALLLGEIRLAFVKRTAECWRYAIPIGTEMMVNWSSGYQADNDARQDCESEVRRLLKEAGVDCE